MSAGRSYPTSVYVSRFVLRFLFSSVSVRISRAGGPRACPLGTSRQPLRLSYRDIISREGKEFKIYEKTIAMARGF
ncbi:MAG: hypothetical protein DBX45_00960 [Oscillospiraceae bacterium]|nr:MAG: hypothetical protein DBX45_00960 [Oscillospiraceae bacterium]